MRGKETDLTVGKLSDRITPAYAGKSDILNHECAKI